MNIKSVISIMNEIKAERKKIFTNYYYNLNDSEKEFDVLQGNGTIVFSVFDGEVYRCYYYSNDMGVLEALLCKQPKNTMLDYMSKNEKEEHPWITSCGFSLYATYVRMGKKLVEGAAEKPDRKILLLEEWYDSNCGAPAEKKDIDQLYELIYQVFDCKKEHLPTKESLEELVNKKWAWIYKKEDEILAFLIYKIEGKKYYANMIYNCLTADISYDLEKNAWQDLINRYDISYSYAWVDMANYKGLRRANLKPDGAYDYIYMKM